MSLSIKSTDFLSSKNLNSAAKNMARKPVKKINFGNEHGDSVFITGKNEIKPIAEMPLSFGQTFAEAAKRISQKFKGNKNDAGSIGKELGKELYGIEIN